MMLVTRGSRDSSFILKSLDPRTYYIMYHIHRYTYTYTQTDGQLTIESRRSFAWGDAGIDQAVRPCASSPLPGILPRLPLLRNSQTPTNGKPSYKGLRENRKKEKKGSQEGCQGVRNSAIRKALKMSENQIYTDATTENNRQNKLKTGYICFFHKLFKNFNLKFS